MKKLLFFIVLISGPLCFAANPIFKDQSFTMMYTADPSAHVYEGKVYVYPSHDQDNAMGYNMVDYHVYSSSDLVKWTDHGKVLDLKDVPWVKEYMWAPDCAYKDGTYYLYFPARAKDGKFYIGVATSKNPGGPFTPESNYIPNSFSVDPAVFIDDDGKAYMYFGGDGDGGQKQPWVAKMKDNMKEFDGQPQKISGAQYWFEACWMHKYNNTYYLSYSTGGNYSGYQGSALGYATSSSPMGPFTFKSVFFPSVSGWTNHHSIVKYADKWYLFYHTAERSGGNSVKRDVCIDYLTYNTDGTIKMVSPTKNGVAAVTVRAEKHMPDCYTVFTKNRLSYSQSSVSYILTEASNVDLKIMTLSGRVVLPLVQGYQTPQQYTVPLNTSTLAHGVFRLQLTTSAGTESLPIFQIGK
jgi:beta-xylosidase